MSTDEFERRYAVPFRDQLPYSPLAAAGLDRIDDTAHLQPAEKGRLARDGFVLLSRGRSPTFALGYIEAFRKHLPVYISADSILFAVHKSFDALLKVSEYGILAGDLKRVVDGMREQLRAGRLAHARSEIVIDVDDYLAVAKSLLDGQVVEPIASGHATLVKELVAHANDGDGMQEIALFGGARAVDFSQFKPRGHYVETPELERYFRAMMWLSRTDFRFVEVMPKGPPVFRRRQVEAALALHELMDEPARTAWLHVDRALEAYVGERDEMNVRDLDTLLHELGVANFAELSKVSDDAIVATLARTGLGQQRIASQLMERSIDARGSQPLHTSFALMNQRYTIDSHVFSNLVYAQVRSGQVKRMMPDPLDIGFAALQNSGAGGLLKAELDRYGYAPDLHRMRLLVDAHGDEYWQKSLYTSWLGALRALSPTEAALKPPSAGGLPAVAATHAWNARILNTQLASWAELKHDTVLYSKQSYSVMPACEFPDAYVDPYPEFFQRIALHARVGKALVLDALSGNAQFAQNALHYFTRLEDVATELGKMAEAERSGTPFTKEQMDFVNQMIRAERSQGCGGPPTFSGWYGDLFLDRSALNDFAPAVADVHTEASDENGSPVGRILHVGTGYANGLIVTVDSCKGPHAYAGYVSSYYEKTTTGFERLDDQEWAREVAKTPASPSWLEPLL